jgi:hypothetical protein
LRSVNAYTTRCRDGSSGHLPADTLYFTVYPRPSRHAATRLRESRLLLLLRLLRGGRILPAALSAGSLVVPGGTHGGLPDTLA